ncbi:MAG TPA: ATP-dependent zinc protease [Thermoanaerobaculia bacterium]|nr:ATP-dependent zinc protease [Thermoanaerobaculia bacterium]
MASRLKRPRPQPVVGWREWVELPGLGDFRIKSKVDTGARSSSLHAYDLEIVERDGVELVRFVVHPLQKDVRTTVECEAPLLERRWVRSSNGVRQRRPVIRTELRLAGQTWPIDLTLTARDVMGFRMLLGREAIRRRFVVDPGRSYLLSERPTRRRRRDPAPS